MTKDFIDDLIEVFEIKKTVNRSSKNVSLSRGNAIVIAGVEIINKRITPEETKIKIRKSVKMAMTEEVRKRMSEAAKGKILSEETKKKLSEALKGRKHPPVTEEARKKMSDFQRNRKREPMSEETKIKLSEASKGKNKPPLSDETKRKMSEVRLGKKKPPRTEEHNRNALAARIASLPSIMTPYGEFVTRKAFIKKLTDDGLLNATDKLREWLKLYQNDYYIIKKPRKSRRIQGVTQLTKSITSAENKP